MAEAHIANQYLSCGCVKGLGLTFFGVVESQNHSEPFQASCANGPLLSHEG